MTFCCYRRRQSFSSGSRGHYVLPLHLEARVSRTFNVSEIIQTQVPDAEGNIIPAVVREGGMKIAGSIAENQHIMIVAEAGIYNVRKATCGVSCGQCDGYSSAAVVAGSFGLPVNATQQLNFMGTWNSGGQYNLGGAWSSNNTPVATVGSGLVTGMSAGSATISALVSNEPIEEGYICYQNSCPTRSFGGGSSGTVSQFNVAYSSYIPVDHVSGPTPCLYGSTLYGKIYMGDANRGTYRTAESILVSTAQHYTNFFTDTGQSRNYGEGSPVNGSTLSAGDEDGIPNDCHLWNAAAKATPSGAFDISYPYSYQTQVHFDGAVTDPLESTPAPVDWDMRTLIDTSNPLAPTALVNYNHTCRVPHSFVFEVVTKLLAGRLY
ncbi:MAG: Ig-like domain-containing protein [Terriglobales bacterium]